jgi:hypothetical protein
MTRVGTHTGWTVWGPQSIDRPEQLRRMTRMRRHLGERRYRELRYSMATARARLDLRRLVGEMKAIRSQLDSLTAT